MSQAESDGEAETRFVRRCRKKTGEAQNGIECQNNQECEAVIALTRRVRRDIRLEAVFGFKTPFVTALANAAVASRSEVFASSAFLPSRASCTFLTTLLTALNVARFRWRRRSDWRARLIVDL